MLPLIVLAGDWPRILVFFKLYQTESIVARDDSGYYIEGFGSSFTGVTTVAHQNSVNTVGGCVKNVLVYKLNEVQQ